jgi:chromosome segregation ATPase
MPNSTQESSALSEILNRLKAMETKAEKFEAKVDKHIEEVGYQFKLAAADRQAIRREMDKRFQEVDKRFETVASASAMREGFMAAAADREAIRLEMREGFRIATERHEKFKTKTEENNAEIIRIISDVGTMTYQKIDATKNTLNEKIEANHKEVQAHHKEAQAFQKSMIEALESINQSLKRFAYLEGEIEELKKDKLIKDATLKRLEQRLTKLEAQVNPA